LIFRTQVLPGTPAKLADAVERFNSTHVSVLCRLIEWVADQPDDAQSAILGLPSPIKQAEAAKGFLKSIATR
jgi:hypothetical protein